MNGQMLFLDLRLYPHRSLSPVQFRRLMLGVVVLMGLASLRFWLLGAWPVVLFMAADVGLIYAAFCANFRSARRFEDVRLDERQLTVRQVMQTGAERLAQFPASWLRVELQATGRLENRLLVTSHGRSLAVGSFLTPEERVQIKDEIEAGLARRQNALVMPPSKGQNS